MKNRPLAQNNITRIRESLPISKSFDGEQYIYEKFKWEGFESLTEVQQKSIPVIGRKINTLVIAPTGSGKTEAAMMPILSFTKQHAQRNSLPRLKVHRYQGHLRDPT